MVTRVTDTLFTLRLLKMLTTDFEDSPAYKMGFIDRNGNRIKFRQDPNNPNAKVENKPRTNSEKASYTLLHRLVFNLKRVLAKVPFGRSKFASYAAAVALIREHAELTEDQTHYLVEKIQEFYDIQPNEITERLNIGGEYNLVRKLEQGGMLIEDRSPCHIVGLQGQYFGIPVYYGKVKGHVILVTSDDLY